MRTGPGYAVMLNGQKVALASNSRGNAVSEAESLKAVVMVGIVIVMPDPPPKSALMS